MTQEQQPEALRLAEMLDSGRWVNYEHREKAAAELRRLHARVLELEAWQEEVRSNSPLLARLERAEQRVQELEGQLVQPSRVQINRWLEVHKLMTIDPDVWRAAQQERKPLTDGEIAEARENLIAAKDELYRSRIGMQCSHCKTGKYRADGNGYNDFHRCDKCRYVPMWHRDGQEFAAPKSAWVCLLCRSSRPGHHGFLIDGTTPCPEGKPS